MSGLKECIIEQCENINSSGRSIGLSLTKNHMDRIVQHLVFRPCTI